MTDVLRHHHTSEDELLWPSSQNAPRPGRNPADPDPPARTVPIKEFELERKAVRRKVPPTKAGPRPEQPFGRPSYNRASGS